ncbi:MAG: hypothetical protein R2688_09025 [Fimbriimonadaceae bacterium]
MTCAPASRNRFVPILLACSDQLDGIKHDGNLTNLLPASQCDHQVTQMCVSIPTRTIVMRPRSDFSTASINPLA